jgi:membrane protein
MAKTATATARHSGLSQRLRRFVQLWVDLFARHDLLNHASAIAFQVLKSIVPLTLFGLALLGAVGERHVWRDTITPAIKPHLQPATFHAIDAAAQKIFASSAGGLLAFSALLSIWYVSGGVRAAMGGINDVYEAKETRPWLVRYAISVGLAIGISVCVIGAVLLAATGAGFVHNGALRVVVDIGRWVVAVAALVTAVGLLVRYAPVERRPTRWASAGSVLVITAWIVATLVFKLFVTHIANFKTATGSLTVFLVLIGYFYTSSIIFLVGVEVDELLREELKGEQRGILNLLFGFNR